MTCCLLLSCSDVRWSFSSWRRTPLRVTFYRSRQIVIDAELLSTARTNYWWTGIVEAKPSQPQRAQSKRHSWRQLCECRNPSQILIHSAAGKRKHLTDCKQKDYMHKTADSYAFPCSPVKWSFKVSERWYNNFGLWKLWKSPLTRSSATAQRQRVSYAHLSWLAHWSCTSLNTASVVQLTS